MSAPASAVTALAVVDSDACASCWEEEPPREVRVSAPSSSRAPPREATAAPGTGVKGLAISVLELCPTAEETAPVTGETVLATSEEDD